MAVEDRRFAEIRSAAPKRVTRLRYDASSEVDHIEKEFEETRFPMAGVNG